MLAKGLESEFSDGKEEVEGGKSAGASTARNYSGGLRSCPHVTLRLCRGANMKGEIGHWCGF